MYQMGGQASHKPEELLFVFKSVLAMYHSLKTQCTEEGWTQKSVGSGPK